MLVTIFKYASWRKNKQGEHLATANVKDCENENKRVTANRETEHLREYLQKEHGSLTVDITV